MVNKIASRFRQNPQSGITMIETMMAAFILVVGSLSMVGLLVRSIATNNRNKMDSTQTMLATAKMLARPGAPRFPGALVASGRFLL